MRSEGIDKVLLADDDTGVRQTAAEILRLAGHEVLEAQDGMVALEMLESNQISVLVLDVLMPRADGIAVLEALDALPVTVVASAFAVEPDARERLGTKVFAYLKKPVPPDRLIEAVESALAHASQGGATAAE
ncbi:MAG TPA: response regulator [Acidimicrobiales bacterium]|nr:response regulator [Acidimicrobiales bacterium]